MYRRDDQDQKEHDQRRGDKYENGFFNYYIISNLIDVPAPEDSLLISLVRRGFLYVVTIKKEG